MCFKFSPRFDWAVGCSSSRCYDKTCHVSQQQSYRTLYVIRRAHGYQHISVLSLALTRPAVFLLFDYWAQFSDHVVKFPRSSSARIDDWSEHNTIKISNFGPTVTLNFLQDPLAAMVELRTKNEQNQIFWSEVFLQLSFSSFFCRTRFDMLYSKPVWKEGPNYLWCPKLEALRVYSWVNLDVFVFCFTVTLKWTFIYWRYPNSFWILVQVENRIILHAWFGEKRGYSAVCGSARLWKIVYVYQTFLLLRLFIFLLFEILNSFYNRLI